jgi:hypothetical protein
MTISKVEISVLESLYLLSYETQRLEPDISNLHSRAGCTLSDLRLSLRKLAMEGLVIGTFLTAQGKILVEESASDQPLIVEVNAFRHAFLSELIMISQSGRESDLIHRDEFELSYKVPPFYFEFSLDVLEQKGFIRQKKGNYIQLGVILESALTEKRKHQ